MKFNKATESCTRVSSVLSINTGWGMMWLREVLQRRTWGYCWMKGCNSTVKLWNKLPETLRKLHSKKLETWLVLTTRSDFEVSPELCKSLDEKSAEVPSNFSVTMSPCTQTWKRKANLEKKCKSTLPQTFIKMLTAFISLVQGPCVIHHSPTSKQNIIFYKTVSENSKQSNSGYNKLHTILQIT